MVYILYLYCIIKTDTFPYLTRNSFNIYIYKENIILQYWFNGNSIAILPANQRKWGWNFANQMQQPSLYNIFLYGLFNVYDLLFSEGESGEYKIKQVLYLFVLGLLTVRKILFKKNKKIYIKMIFITNCNDLYILASSCIFTLVKIQIHCSGKKPPQQTILRTFLCVKINKLYKF